MTHAARALLLLLPSLFAAGSAPAQERVTLAQLADRVERAHRPDAEAKPVREFVCDLELHLIDRRAEQAGQVDMAVRFMLWQQPDSGKVRKLIRYSVRDAEQPIVRGRDRHGPWQLHLGEPRDLYGADFTEQDRKTFEQHTNLARQLLQFLSPADVIRGLKNPGLVEEQVLEVRRRPTRCHTIEGRVDAFPLMQQAGEDAAVQLKVFVRQDDGRVCAVEATPLVDGAPAAARGERILLAGHEERAGRLVPYEVTHLFRDEKGLHAVTRVKLTNVALDPSLTVDDFDRKKL